ncbi:hypothetical protein [Actinophytocola glycyrrhizae]|uniref:DUF5753 domain-containing protein n=1 Tax=Actinophytocola glycyrrhizae TaxID=2044873 RepID=A0ABV9RZR2_9PSEU
MIDHDEISETEAPADPWSALLPRQELVPAYPISRFAGQYRVIVDVLLAEQDISLTGLSHDEVAAGIVLASPGRCQRTWSTVCSLPRSCTLTHGWSDWRSGGF